MEDAKNPSLLSLDQMLAFLQSKLPAAELESIEAQIQNDPLQALALQELDLALRAGKTPEELLAQGEQTKAWAQKALDAQLNQGAKIKNVGAPGARRWMAAAIILLLLLPIGYWWFQPDPAVQLAQTALAEHYPIPGTRGVDNKPALPVLLESAYSAYSQDQYDAALPFFTELREKHQEALTPAQLEQVLLYNGISLLKADPSQPGAALTILNAPQVLQADNAEIASAAQYHAALAYLQQQDLPQAQALLKPLTEKPNRFQRRAKELLSQIAEL